MNQTDWCPFCGWSGRDGHSNACPKYSPALPVVSGDTQIDDVKASYGLGRHFPVFRAPVIVAPEPPNHEDGITDGDLATEMASGLGLKPKLEPQLLSTDSAERKRTPVYSGVIKYFPRALAYVSQISWAGNEKHNPGEPLHWSRGKSNDHLDCVARHLIDAGRVDPEDGLLHDGKLVWRALANLELFLEQQETK